MDTTFCTTNQRKEYAEYDLENKEREAIVDALKNGKVQLVINTTEGVAAIADSFSLRRTALIHNIPYFTTVAGARAAAEAIAAMKHGELDVTSLQAYFLR